MLGLGTAGGGMADAISCALKSGISLVDTAQNYGSEADVGDGLRKSGVERGRAFILGKVDLCSLAHEDPAARVRRQVASTLANLGVDRLDAVAFHWPIPLDKQVTADEQAAVRRAAWEALEALHDEGVVGLLGVSNWTAELLDELLAFARIRPALNEVEFSPACYSKRQEELLAACEARELAVVGYSPYGTCWFTACYPAVVPWGSTDLIADAVVAAVAAEAGCSPALALLRWSLQHGVVTIPKSTKPARVAESLRAIDGSVRLSAEQMGRLDALGDARRGTAASLEAHGRLVSDAQLYSYTWVPT